MGGVNAPKNTQKMPCKANYRYSNITGGVRFPKTLWVSDLKLGAVGGARSSLITAHPSEAWPCTILCALKWAKQDRQLT